MGKERFFCRAEWRSVRHSAKGIICKLEKSYGRALVLPRNPPFTVSGWSKPHSYEINQLSAANFRPSRFNGKFLFVGVSPHHTQEKRKYPGGLIPTYVLLKYGQRTFFFVGRNAPFLRTPPIRHPSGKKEIVWEGFSPPVKSTIHSQRMEQAPFVRN